MAHFEENICEFAQYSTGKDGQMRRVAAARVVIFPDFIVAIVSRSLQFTEESTKRKPETIAEQT